MFSNGSDFRSANDKKPSACSKTGTAHVADGTRPGHQLARPRAAPGLEGPAGCLVGCLAGCL
eukprot:9404764-Heterocapsa_arctica.AAC.1